MTWHLTATAVLATLILTVSPTTGRAETPTAANLDSFSYSVEDLGTPIKSYSVMDCSLTTRTGEPVLSVVVSVSTATLNLISLRENKLIKSFPLVGSSASWSSTVTPDGMIYIGTDQSFFQCDPKTQNLKNLGPPLPGESFTFCLTHDETGKVYGGTYPGGKVFEFDPATSKFRELVDTKKNYVRSIDYGGGIIYAGTGPVGAPRLVAINIHDGSCRDISLPTVKGTPNFVYGVDVRGHYLFCHITTAKGFNAFVIRDLNLGEWLPIKIEGYHGAHVSPEHDGAVYIFSQKSLKRFDLKTGVVTDSKLAYATAYRGGGWFDMNSPEFPGKSLVTVGWDGHPIIMNPETSTVKPLPIVAQADATELHAMTTGADGLVYISSFLSSQGARYNTATGTSQSFTMGQAESIGAGPNAVYFGVYPKAHVFALDYQKPIADRKNPRELFHIGDMQDRPYSVLVTSHTLYYGTIPGYGQLGGALTKFSLGGGAATTWRNVVKNQSIVGLTKMGNRLIGSTTIEGGLGSIPTAKSARLFAWDIAADKKIGEASLGLKAKGSFKMIGGLAASPDGLIWGTAQGWIFAMDPATLKVVKSKNLYPEVGNFTKWMPPSIHFLKNGLIVANVGFKLTIVDPGTLKFRRLENGVFATTIGPDGNIYFAGDPARNHLKRIRF